MRRRTLLASSAGLLAGLAGCIDADPGGTTGGDEQSPVDTTGDGSPTDGDTPTRDGTDTEGATDTPTATETGGVTPVADVTVESLTLQYGFVEPDSPDSIWVAETETPYVVAAVSVDGPINPEDFALAVGDERYRAIRQERLFRTSWGDDEWYERDGSGLLLFELPTDPGDGDVRLTWPGGEHAPDASEAVRARLDRGPPELSVSIDVPESWGQSQAPPVDIEITNEGDVPARFLGALNRIGPLVAYAPLARLTELVPAGETVTITYDDSWSSVPKERVGDDEPDVRYFLHFAGGEASAEIVLEASAADTTTPPEGATDTPIETTRGGESGTATDDPTSTPPPTTGPTPTPPPTTGPTPTATQTSEE